MQSNAIKFLLYIFIVFYMSSCGVSNDEIAIALTATQDNLNNEEFPTATGKPTQNKSNNELFPGIPMATATPMFDIGSTFYRSIDETTMMYIPEGWFVMGSDYKSNENPINEVFLDAFWMDKYEITNEQFGYFVSETRYVTDAENDRRVYGYKNGEWIWIRDGFWANPQGPGSNVEDKMNHPVSNISWNDAVAYCEWAGASLPTEAQWEKAAKGPINDKSIKNTYPWGVGINDYLANYNSNELGTMPIGTYLDGGSVYGIFDLSGNLREWTADWYFGDQYFSIGNNNINPTGHASGQYRVQRGGSWRSNEDELRVSYRDFDTPTDANALNGFRCVSNDTP